jgi:MYXO-CTERM domain-containing protein
MLAGSARAAVIFDNFETSEGHFNLAPSFSGSTVGISSTSTADRDTTDGIEGPGGSSEKLVLVHTTSTTATRVRFLSGGGSPGGASGSPANTQFQTTSGTDGWIGLYAKTTNANWTIQIWVEPGTTSPAAAGNNGSNPKTLIADGAWHLYEWNLDDISGGVDGWGGVAGIATGQANVADGYHAIDSILLRDTNATQANTTATISLDFLAKSDSGSVSTVPFPEPMAMGLLALVAPWALRRRK